MDEEILFNTLEVSLTMCGCCLPVVGPTTNKGCRNISTGKHTFRPSAFYEVPWLPCAMHQLIRPLKPFIGTIEALVGQAAPTGYHHQTRSAKAQNAESRAQSANKRGTAVKAASPDNRTTTVWMTREHRQAKRQDPTRCHLRTDNNDASLIEFTFGLPNKVRFCRKP